MLLFYKKISTRASLIVTWFVGIGEPFRIASMLCRVYAVSLATRYAAISIDILVLPGSMAAPIATKILRGNGFGRATKGKCDVIGGGGGAKKC